MRTTFSFFVIVFLFIQSCSPSKTVGPSTEPVGRSSGIILKVNESPDRAFKNLQQFLTENGFEYKEINPYGNYLKTNYKTMNGEMYTYQIEAAIPPTDSTIIIFRSRAIGPYVESPSLIRSSSGQFNNSLWQYFHEVVTAFPHENVYYTSE